MAEPNAVVLAKNSAYRSATEKPPAFCRAFLFLSLAGTNRAAATWAVGDALESIVEDLRTSSVAFEHYDLPKTTRDGDIHEMAGMRGVWFKDPDGSIIGLVNQ